MAPVPRTKIRIRWKNSITLPRGFRWRLAWRAGKLPGPNWGRKLQGYLRLCGPTGRQPRAGRATAALLSVFFEPGGLRVLVETPGPPVFGKERVWRKYVYFRPAPDFPSRVGLFDFLGQVVGSAHLMVISSRRVREHDTSRQIRAANY